MMVTHCASQRISGCQKTLLIQSVVSRFCSSFLQHPTRFSTKILIRIRKMARKRQNVAQKRVFKKATDKNVGFVVQALPELKVNIVP